MESLHLKIIEASEKWREDGYPCEGYPAIKYLLEHNYNADSGYRFLRPPQFEALEIYWYLRLKLSTPSFLDLYKHFYPTKSELYQALGIASNDDFNKRLQDDEDLANILQDETFIRTHRLETIHESLSLSYASYILALTMGAGKTILIASIIATEFAMSLEYKGDDKFMKNALVFAPDKTIIDSLREIADTPFEKILPASDYLTFMANLKLIYTQDGQKEIGGLIEKSSYNIVVTNTQKIIPRKSNTAQGTLDMPLRNKLKREQKEYIINLRLQRIASLPAIGIFSDEAHHTYGNKIGEELKRVREAINYIGNETNIICVVNTTGTPYSKKKVLKDVVYWYSLQQGITDNILKSLHNSIIAYDFSEQTEEAVIEEVINDFFDEYGSHTLPNGAPAKIAFYFKSKAHLAECKSIIERVLTVKQQAPSLILQNTEDASTQEKEEFRTLNNPANQKRVILLVQKGTEGWNCPSLFATALIREVKSSNNFILQSATRCLRQVAGNSKPARIYIESKNQRILNKELEENFGTDLAKLRDNFQKYDTYQVIIKKSNLPKLEITQLQREKRTITHNRKGIHLAYPNETEKQEDDIIYKTIYQPNLTQKGKFLGRKGLTENIEIKSDTLDLFTATKDIASRYHLSYLSIFKQLQSLYSANEVPKKHIFALCKQIDDVQNEFETTETKIVQALALIKTQDEAGNDIFEKDEDGFYHHNIRYKKSTQPHLLAEDEIENLKKFGFHYAPYHFDSETEKEFFKEICQSLNVKPDDIQDIYFTGGLTSEKYTDIAFEYRSTDGKHKKYYPDFVILKTNGEFVIVEIKAADQEDGHDLNIVAKEEAVQKIANIEGNKFKYHILYTDRPIPTSKLREVQTLIYD